MAMQVKDWNDHYENAKSRTIKSPSWCAIPNKQDGLSYRRLVSRDPVCYAVFVGIVLACSKQPSSVRNGWLTDDGKSTGRPWTAEDLALKTSISEELIAKALPVLCSPEIDWMAEEGTDVKKPKKEFSGD